MSSTQNNTNASGPLAKAIITQKRKSSCPADSPSNTTVTTDTSNKKKRKNDGSSEYPSPSKKLRISPPIETPLEMARREAREAKLEDEAQRQRQKENEEKKLAKQKKREREAALEKLKAARAGKQSTAATIITRTDHSRPVNSSKVSKVHTEHVDSPALVATGLGNTTTKSSIQKTIEQAQRAKLPHGQAKTNTIATKINANKPRTTTEYNGIQKKTKPTTFTDALGIVRPISSKSKAPTEPIRVYKIEKVPVYQDPQDTAALLAKQARLQASLNRPAPTATTTTTTTKKTATTTTAVRNSPTSTRQPRKQKMTTAQSFMAARSTVEPGQKAIPKDLIYLGTKMPVFTREEQQKQEKASLEKFTRQQELENQGKSRLMAAAQVRQERQREEARQKKREEKEEERRDHIASGRYLPPAARQMEGGQRGNHWKSPLNQGVGQ